MLLLLIACTQGTGSTSIDSAGNELLATPNRQAVNIFTANCLEQNKSRQVLFMNIVHICTTSYLVLCTTQHQLTNCKSTTPTGSHAVTVLHHLLPYICLFSASVPPPRLPTSSLGVCYASLQWFKPGLQYSILIAVPRLQSKWSPACLV